MGTVFSVTIPVVAELPFAGRTGVLVHGFAFYLGQMAVPPPVPAGITAEDLLSVPRILEKGLSAVFAYLLHYAGKDGIGHFFTNPRQLVAAAKGLDGIYIQIQRLGNLHIAHAGLAQFGDPVFLIVGYCTILQTEEGDLMSPAFLTVQG